MGKNYIYIFLLLFVFSNIKCDDDYDYDYTNNINIESISYELTYNNYSVVKVVLKSYYQLYYDVSFIAYLKSEEGDKAYPLKCSSTYYDIIECYSRKNEIFNTNDRYYFYYNKTNSSILFDENDILEDDKRISLVFEPELEIDDKLYRDNHKIIIQSKGDMVSGGYLYIVKNSKSVLQRPKDGFNQYIELNNIIPHVGLHEHLPPSTLQGFTEAINKGYHIINAEVRFTSDKMPVICDDNKLENISNGKGNIANKTFQQLEELNFGSKFDKKYSDEKIMTLAELLALCRQSDVIIDLNLDNLDYNKYFNSTRQYMYIIIRTIENLQMTNSVIFEGSADKILKLKEIRTDIAVSIKHENLEELKKMKDAFNDFKRVIYSFEKNVDDETIKYAVSLKRKVKVSLIDDKEHVKKLQSLGVNFILTRNLPPWIIENEKEEPIIVRCSPTEDQMSECDIEDYMFLQDNELYDIYFSHNIYNISQDISEEPIAQFQYINTNLLDELYYYIHYFSFEKNIITLILSDKLPKGEQINGIIGPNQEDMEDCYLYSFECKGNNTYSVNCKINKDEAGKIHFNWAHYTILSLEDYSLNEFETEQRKMDNENYDYQEKEGYINYVVEKEPSILYVCLFVFIVIVIVIIFFLLRSTKCKKQTRTYVRITDNNYITDDNLYRY